MGGKVLSRVRNFIAVPLEGEPRALLWDALNSWRKLQPGLKWEKRGNFHITLKFIGNSTEKELKRIDRIITEIFKDVETFSVPLTGMGAFPDFERPRVIWLGATFPDSFISLVEELDRALFSELRIPQEKRGFVPHITVARVKAGGIKEELKKSFENFNGIISGKKMKISKIVHFKSELKPEGAIHTPVFTLQLPPPGAA